MRTVVILLITALLFTSCKKPVDDGNLQFSFGGGVYIVNEGNFRAGNGSLSYFSYDSTKIYNDLFYTVNNRPLGDVPNYAAIKNGYLYIVVNNSGKIEVTNQNTLASIATISHLNSPRKITFINDNKAYVSSLYSDSVAVIDLSRFTVSGYINLRRTSESIIVSGAKAFVASWAGGHEVMVVNTLTDQVVDSIQVGAEPESMVRDKYGMVWVLCNGGWMRQNYAEIDQINSYTNKVEKKLVFPTKEASPTTLTIDGTGTNLYYIENGIHTLDINSEGIPASILIPQGTGQYFYSLAVNPVNGDVLISDAGDFVSPGNLLVYSEKGVLATKQKTGLIPGAMCFKLTVNTTTTK